MDMFVGWEKSNMLLLKIVDRKPIKYRIEQLYADYPNTSFPKPVTDELLRSFDIYRYTVQHEPHDPLVEKSVESKFEQVDGAWVLFHKPERLPIDDAKENIRSERNKRLAETDWMVMVDRMPTEMQLSYRQDLRDITNQIGFPYQVDWPIYNIHADNFVQG